MRRRLWYPAASWSPRSRPARPAAGLRRPGDVLRGVLARPRRARPYATTFLEFRGGADAGALRARARRASTPTSSSSSARRSSRPARFAGLRARTVGFLTEPLPRTAVGAPRHEDLERRLWELGHVDRTNFDRIVAFDPHIAATADARRCPSGARCRCPVADRFYAPVRPAPPSGARDRCSSGARPRTASALLADAKHHFDLLHLAFGVDAAQLQRGHGGPRGRDQPPQRALPELREPRLPAPRGRAPRPVSEPLQPDARPRAGHRLPRDPDARASSPGPSSSCAASPALWHRVRVRGRRKAEQFRASRVYPRLLADLEADLAAFGSPRAAASGH